MDLTHSPIDIKDWKGMYTRGSEDSSPPGYLSDCLNVKFTESEVLSRDGSALFLDTSGSADAVNRFFSYKKLTTTRTLYSKTSSVGPFASIFDSLAVGFAIASIGAVSDFSMINFNDRAYLSFHDRTYGTLLTTLLVYDDILIGGLARVAAGAAPTGYVVAAVESATAGHVEAGIHLVAIVNITNSGFITAPGPNIVAVTSTGAFKIDVSNIDAGPIGTVARGIVATKAIQNYNGDPNSYEFFQVPSTMGGLVSNNLNNETAALNFFDSELTISADYLFDNRSTIPSGTGMCEYKGRMVIWGFSADPHSVYLSRPYAPEEFDSVGGVISVDPFESHSQVTNCFVFRGSLIICKKNRIYQTTDNGGDPSSWNVDMIDNGAGTECFGVSVIIDSKGQENDRTFIADRSGLLIFEGFIRRPECSWLVEDTWKRINKAVFNLIQVVSDPLTSSLFVSLPLDTSTTINYLLYGYYGSAFVDGGFEPKLIKWSLWQFAQGHTSILMDVDLTTSLSVFRYAGSANNIYSVKFDGTVHSDAGTRFPSFVDTAYYTTKAGWINHFAGVKLRVQGIGDLSLKLYGEDEVDTTTLASITLTPLPGKEFFREANFKNEKAFIRITGGVWPTDYFELADAILYAKPLWFGRPK